MKKKLLNLENLKVQSFVTSFGDQDVNTIKGGAKVGGSGICSGSGICICKTEDCETQVACDLTNDCPPIKTGL